jgi:iron complex outermembrane receptor protein
MTNTIISTSRLRAALLVGISAIAMTAATPAVIHSSARAATAAGAPEEIIVTTRKREETIMKAPIIVQAIGNKQIEDLHINSVTALTSVAPGTFVNYGLAQSGVNLAVRGIANSGSNLFGDQSIALNIDGFTSSVGTLYRQGIFDAAQIEVLKGPQSLFYGKSTSGGMIALHSADPTKDWQVQAQVGYEFKADEMDLNGFISGPITDTLGIRIAGYHNTSKGYLRNANPNGVARYPAEDDNGGRLTLKYDNPDIGLRVKFKAAYTHDRLNVSYVDTEQQVCAGPPNPNPIFKYDNCTLDLYSYGTQRSLPYSATANFSYGAAGTGFATNMPYPMFKDGQPYSVTETALAVLSIDYDIAKDITLTSVTGMDYINGIDAGRNNSVIGLNDIGSQGKFHEFSEELRLTTNWKDRWYNFMVGGLYNPSHRNDQLNLTFPAPDVVPFENNFTSTGVSRFESEADGAFAQALLTPVDKWELSGGIRWSRVHKAFTNNTITYNLTSLPGNGVNVIPLLAPGQAGLTETAWTPEATLTYRPTDDLTAFVSYKKGYKGPAANSNQTNTANNAASWKPLVGGEHVHGFEGGVKAKLMDHQITLNASGYIYTYQGLQTTVYIPALNTANLSNGASAKVQGFELGGEYSPEEIRGLTLKAFLNYNDTHYIKFTGATCWAGMTAAQGCMTVGPGKTAQDLSGRTTFLAPKLVANIGASYKWDLSDKYTAGISGEAQYTSSYYGSSDLEPFSHQGAYALVNMSAHLAKSDDSWDLAVLCRNCTNKIYVAYGTDGGFVAPAANVNIGHPLQIMVQLTVRPSLF